MDPNLPWWIQSSLSLYLKQVADSLSVEFFAEGVDEEVAAAFHKDSILLRINGPFIITDGYSLEVQVVVTDLVSQKESSKDHFTRCGTIASALYAPIPINRNGNGNDLLGCLSPARSSNDVVKVLHFGQVDPNMRVRQSAVLASYELFV
jgi:hypothetical protein